MSKVYYTPEEKISSLITILEKRDKEIKRKGFVIDYLIGLLQHIVTRYDISHTDLIEYATTVLRRDPNE